MYGGTEKRSHVCYHEYMVMIVYVNKGTHNEIRDTIMR